jgi:hypothetical protein
MTGRLALAALQATLAIVLALAVGAIGMAVLRLLEGQ